MEAWIRNRRNTGGTRGNRLRAFVKDLWPFPYVLHTLRHTREAALALMIATPTPYGFRLRTPRYRNMKLGEYEHQELCGLERLAAEEKVDALIDVGANFGLYSCYGMSKGLQVVAFEPLARNLRYLYRNIRADHWVGMCEVWPMAVTSKPGLQRLFDGGGGPAASLISGWGGMNRKFNTVVPTTSLDVAITPRFQGRKLFVKVDVEGAELEVLRGAHELLRSTPPPIWQIEICFDECHPNGRNPDFQAVFELMASHGYEARTADQTFRRIPLSDVRCWVEEDRIPFAQRDFLFMRPR